MEITENLKFLELNVQDKTIPLTRDTQKDDSELIPGMSTIPVSIKDYYLLPKMIRTGVLATNQNSQFLIVHNLRNYWPEIFNFYSAIRYSIRYRLITRSSFNHTGLVALSWQKIYNIPGYNQNIYYSSNFCPSYSYNYPWYCMPEYRAYMRIGKDTECELTIPWVSNVACFRNGDSDLDVNQLLNPTRGDNNFAQLGINNLTPLRTIAGAPQEVQYWLWAEPVDISVGGIKSDI